MGAKEQKREKKRERERERAYVCVCVRHGVRARRVGANKEYKRVIF